MTIFADKLATLAATARLAGDGPIAPIAAALREGEGRSAVAIGSGGSAIAAEYFARCRSTLGLGLTLVQTPMEFVLAQEAWDDFEIWLFSAGADNSDVAAAFTSARDSLAARVRLLTVNGEGATALAAAQDHRIEVMVAPVAERKDGFLATHSLIAMVASLLAASEQVAAATPNLDIIERYADAVQETVSGPDSLVPSFRAGDTILLLYDPQCRALATLIETSLWETGMAPIQRTDFRNFAHGRHVWPARHPESTFILAVTTALSRDVWRNIRHALPEAIRMVELNLGHAGRFRSAVSIVEGLMAILVIGAVTDTDPGKPGRGAFAGALYGDEGLSTLAKALGPAVRHKLEAVQRHDNPACPVTSPDAARTAWLSAVSETAIGAVVLDYDGTLVTTSARLEPPSPALVAELTRLADLDIAIAFATGRGGSAGDALRAALPQRLHPEVIIGYYNGGHMRPLNVNIETDPPEAHPDLASLADWIEEQGLLRPGVSLKRGRVQVTVNHADILAPAAFFAALEGFPPVAEGRLKRLSSHHSFDLVPAGTSKTAVCDALRLDLAEGHRVLAIGDSGEPGGNDTELLAGFPSISVDGVCGHLDGSWSLFGRSSSGPAALLRILRALHGESGHVRLNLNLLDASLT